MISLKYRDGFLLKKKIIKEKENEGVGAGMVQINA